MIDTGLSTTADELRRSQALSRSHRRRDMARANQTCSSTATYWIAIAIYWLSAACVTGLIGVTKAIGQGLCKPTPWVNDVQFSPIHPETLVRNWTAVVSVDASQSRANFRGTFDIVFMRLSETAPDIGALLD